MKRRYVLASMGAFTASASLAVGSSAFSSTEAARQTNVDVVGDEDAYLGIQYSRNVKERDDGTRFVRMCDDTVTLCNLVNNSPSPFSIVDVNIIGDDTDGFEIKTEEIDDYIEVSIRATDAARDGSEKKIGLKIDASGSGFAIEAQRDFRVIPLSACFETFSADIQATGNGKFQRASINYELNRPQGVTFTAGGATRTEDGGGPTGLRVPQGNDGSNFPIRISGDINEGECFEFRVYEAEDDIDILDIGQRC